MDVVFAVGSGYGGMHKKFPIRLPAGYQFSFDIKAEFPTNNFEFKLIDTTGQNVWWLNKRNFTFPAEWTTIRIKKRHISFAWGPSNAGLESIGGVEFIVAAGSGGKGTIWLDNFVLEARDDNPILEEPVVSASTSQRQAGLSLDGDLSTAWKSSSQLSQQWVMIDFRRQNNGKLVTWNDARISQTLEKEYLPVPTVVWRKDDPGEQYWNETGEGEPVRCTETFSGASSVARPEHHWRRFSDTHHRAERSVNHRQWKSGRLLTIRS